MRVACAILIISFMIASLAGCARRGDCVLVVEKTKSYHTDNCARIHMAHAAWMTRDEARARDCKPCPGCKPDRGL
ncbi:MAG: hypothetical protein HYR77_07445 [Ignavibacteria bacterium]|nr:hypothetical protein [Ignavibacteria bacterium]